MPDYGHPLRFATFIGPTNSPPSRPVELAQLSERLGFDFVTFQDHPCLLYTSPSPRDGLLSRMPSSA